MPVWHERTKKLRAAGKVKVIGIAQEQHPDRCLLFTRWKGIDFPVLWDPFNLTGTKVVPRVTLIDEHGIVRATRASLATFEEDFIGKTFPKPAKAAPLAPKGKPGTLVEVAEAAKGSEAHAYYDALSAFLWPSGRDGERAKTVMLTYAKDHPKDAAAQWRLGVAYRLRHDSLERSLGDFQRAVDQWRIGLELDPSHYIYRRRVEQFGPLLTKPYPFYPWIAAARKALGAKAPPLVAEPTRSELAGREPMPAKAAERPDTRGADASLQDALRFETTVVWHADRQGRMAARVHLHVLPAGNRVLLWDKQRRPVTLWVESSEGFLPESNRFSRPLLGRDRAEEIVPFDFEVRPESGKGAPFELSGFLLYVAEPEIGKPRTLLQRFEVTVRGPSPGK